MKVIFLLNLDMKIKSGLFHAIHNRMKINNNQFSCKFYNVIIVDSKPLAMLKKIMGKSSYINYISEYKTEIDGVEYINIQYKNTILGKILEKLKFEHIQYRNIIRKLSESINEADKVVAHWGYPHGRIAYFIKKTYKKKYVVYYHGSDINCFTRDDLRKREKILQTMKYADNNIFIGKPLMEKVINMGYKKNNLTYTENGVNDDIFNLKNIKNQRNKYVGFVGNVEGIKRAEFLPDIFKKIYQMDDEVRFFIIGEGTLKHYIEQRCCDEKIPVKFLGRLDSINVAKYMNKFSIVLLPSRYESWGSVILEANACGAYVVASNTGGIPYVVGEYGTLVDNCDETIVEQSAYEVINALNKNIDRLQLAERAAYFKWNKICEREYEFINK